MDRGRKSISNKQSVKMCNSQTLKSLNLFLNQFKSKNNCHWLCETVNPEMVTQFWLLIVTMSFIYNALACSLFAFYEFHRDYFNIWIVLNITSDLIYLVDILVQFTGGKYPSLSI